MRGVPIKYSADEMRWLADNRMLPISEYHRQFCTKFQRHDVSPNHLHQLRRRNGWLTGRTKFAAGHVPWNKGKKLGNPDPRSWPTQFHAGDFPHNVTPLGRERLSCEGYVEICVQLDRGLRKRGYVFKHRLLWEQRHGPVPAGFALKCKGDKRDCDPDNWMPVPRSFLPRLTARDYDRAPDELKPSILAVAQLEHKLKSRQADIP